VPVGIFSSLPARLCLSARRPAAFGIGAGCGPAPAIQHRRSDGDTLTAVWSGRFFSDLMLAPGWLTGQSCAVPRAATPSGRLGVLSGIAPHEETRTESRRGVFVQFGTLCKSRRPALSPGRAPLDRWHPNSTDRPRRVGAQSSLSRILPFLDQCARAPAAGRRCVGQGAAVA
jgi:hypothetical protein